MTNMMGVIEDIHDSDSLSEEPPSDEENENKDEENETMVDHEDKGQNNVYV